ncbi:MAG: alkaline phosphatase family protein [Pseudonocardia sp.]|nr:alkaline phosphatase family protein [Pseudonocardia sp.]
MPALAAAIGVPGIGMVTDLGLQPARAAALLLVDGLGSDLLAEHSADASFLTSLATTEPLTAGFPSSTSISLSSLGTGLPPGGHGMVGISFRAAGDALLDSLKWSTYGEPHPMDLRDFLPPEHVQPWPTVLQRAAAEGVHVTSVVPREFRGSGLTRAALRGGTFHGVHAMGDLAAGVIESLAGPGQRLVYGYHAKLDTLGHLHGPGSLPWRMQLRLIDRLVETIVERLPPDGMLAITGDHGMVRVTRHYDADVLGGLQHGVRLLGGDPRARHVYTEPGAEDDVLASWQGILGDDAWVLTRDEAVETGWFGTLGEHIAPRIGDVVVAMRGAAGVTRTTAEPVISGMPGQHGSLSSAEQLVPFLVAIP